MNTKTCNNCSKQFSIDEMFKSKTDLRETKTCLNCRIQSRKYNPVRCIHDRQKAFCLECDGSAYCEHKIQKAVCLECGGNSICIHKFKKSSCKICCDSRDVTIKHMVSSSKQGDKIHNRYDETKFVDYKFMDDLITKSNNKCCYCCKTMNFDKRNPLLATIERINNSFGHNKDNVKIACFTCNISKVGNKITYLNIS